MKSKTEDLFKKIEDKEQEQIPELIIQEQEQTKARLTAKGVEFHEEEGHFPQDIVGGQRLYGEDAELGQYYMELNHLRKYLKGSSARSIDYPDGEIQKEIENRIDQILR